MSRLHSILVIAGLFVALPAQASALRVVGALGDSISAGFNARRLGDNRDLSWSTGTDSDVESHYRRHLAQSSSIVAFNDAIAGSTVTDLDRQIGRMLRHDPDYLTITIGANDVCTWPEAYDGNLAQFESTLQQAISRLVTARPEITIFLAPIPDLVNLWEIASPHDGCYSRWERFGICQPLLGRNVTPQQRDLFAERWRRGNDAIARVAQQFPDQVLHDPELRQIAFTWEHLSPIDCFHPSIKGQNLLSEQAWLMYWNARH